LINYAHRKQRSEYVTPEVERTLNQFGYDYQSEHSLLGVQYHFTDKIRLGYYMNYILGADASFVLQVLL